MKRYLFVLISCSFLFSCTKEGLPGPQGPEGPEGEAGALGAGGGGTATNIISVMTPNQVIFSWERISRYTDNAVYRLKWKVGATEGTTFRLPDSLTARIDNGALLVYVIEDGSDELRDNRILQLAYAPAEFYPLSTYIYQLEKIAGRYVITVLADMQDYGTPYKTPMKFAALKFLIIPQTGTGTIEWG
ncbi:MAG: hypothetical protein J7621_17365 [Niastella sp.]|nr:hypothetical protein [Niastella sp.]